MYDNDVQKLVLSYVNEANRVAFGFNLSNFVDVQFTEYDGSYKGFYDWHVDVDWAGEEAFDRKLSFVLQLSDPATYVGRGLELACEQQPPMQKQGSIVVFPSYLKHKVHPVESGTRYSLVGWVEGPRWR